MPTLINDNNSLCNRFFSLLLCKSSSYIVVVLKTYKCTTIIIFSDEYFSSLILPFSDKKIFVINTIHSNTYSNKIFCRYRLIKFTPSFFPPAPLFQINNSDENYFLLLNVIIFFIIRDEIHISSLKLYF